MSYSRIPSHRDFGGNLGQQDYRSEIVSNFSSNQENQNDFQLLKQHNIKMLKH